MLLFYGAVVCFLSVNTSTIVAAKPYRSPALQPVSDIASSHPMYPCKRRAVGWLVPARRHLGAKFWSQSASWAAQTDSHPAVVVVVLAVVVLVVVVMEIVVVVVVSGAWFVNRGSAWS